MPLRNLLAHANPAFVMIGDEMSIVLTVADLGLAMNARVIAESDLQPLFKVWRTMFEDALDDARRLPA